MRGFLKMSIILPTVAAIAPAAASPPGLRTLKDASSAPTAKISDVAFLAGHWIGEGLGACAEEIMAPPAGGQIMGMFRQMKPDGGLMFYEFYTIAEEGGSLILKIKHFNPDLTGWEEKAETVNFPLVAIEGTTAYFDGLTFSRQGRNGFASAVMIEDQGIATFEMRKAKKGEACGAKD